MPQWSLVLLGLGAGVVVLGGSLAMAFWLRDPRWLPKATDGNGDPMSGGTQ